MNRTLAIRTSVIVVVMLLAVAGPAWADLKIMPLGNSNTGVDPDLFPSSTNLNKYRENLYNLLTADGYAVDFVGTQNSGEAGLSDHDHEGHGAYTINQIAYGPAGSSGSPSGGIHDWLAQLAPADTPDIVLLMVGTNDVIAGSTARANAPGSLSNLIDLLIAELPSARILVSTIPPLTSPYSSTQNSNYVVPYNDALRTIVLGKGGNVRLVDAYAVLSASDMEADGLHLNAAGCDKLGQVWYDAIVPEPGTLALLACGLPICAAALRRRAAS